MACFPPRARRISHAWTQPRRIAPSPSPPIGGCPRLLSRRRQRPVRPRWPPRRRWQGRPPHRPRYGPTRRTGPIMPTGAPRTVLSLFPQHQPLSAPISPVWPAATRQPRSAGGCRHWAKCSGSTIFRGTLPIAISRGRCRERCAAMAGRAKGRGTDPTHAAPASGDMRCQCPRPERPRAAAVRLRRRAAPLRAGCAPRRGRRPGPGGLRLRIRWGMTGPGGQRGLN
jgi:hypothetical protein